MRVSLILVIILILILFSGGGEIVARYGPALGILLAVAGIMLLMGRL
jgi:hypothetical protein